MRKNKSNRGKLFAALSLLAAIWLAAGTFGIFQLRNFRDRFIRYDEVPVQEYEEETAEENENSATDLFEEEEPEEEPEEEEKDYVVMIVRAPDNYAAVRTGRGTQFEEVGRITNGHRVALKDLENGWYKIAKGKYKGYYTHQSSYVSE